MLSSYILPACHLLILLSICVISECFRYDTSSLSFASTSRLFSTGSTSLSDAEKMKQAVGYKVHSTYLFMHVHTWMFEYLCM